MTDLLRTQPPTHDLGMLSLVLATIALLLSFLPVLGVPIGGVALLVGILALILAPFPLGGRLRWALAGSVLSAMALAVNLAIAYAPGGYLPEPHAPPPWQRVPHRPSVPPPARPMLCVKGQLSSLFVLPHTLVVSYLR